MLLPRGRGRPFTVAGSNAHGDHGAPWWAAAGRRVTGDPRTLSMSIDPCWIPSRPARHPGRATHTLGHGLERRFGAAAHREGGRRNSGAIVVGPRSSHHQAANRTQPKPIPTMQMQRSTWLDADRHPREPSTGKRLARRGMLHPIVRNHREVPRRLFRQARRFFHHLPTSTTGGAASTGSPWRLSAQAGPSRIPVGMCAEDWTKHPAWSSIRNVPSDS